MKYFFLVFILSGGQKTLSQNFLDAYKKFYTIKIKKDNTFDSIRKSNPSYSGFLSKKEIRNSKKRWLNLIEQQVLQFDTIFQNYKAKTGFDFKNADSITIVYQTTIESNLSDFIIYSGKDTITYGEQWKMITLHSSIRQVIFKPFLDTTVRPSGFKVVTERDSLLTIAAKGNCNTAQLLAVENKVLDGATSTIIKAKKINGQYHITECFLQPFTFVPIWRKE